MKFALPSKDKPSKERKPKGPFARALHGQKLLVDIYKQDGMYCDTSEKWVDLNEPTILSMGYLPAEDYQTGFSYVLAHVYVKFNGFVRNPRKYMVIPEDGRMNPYEETEETMETASTLYDYFASDAQEEFVNSMRSRGMTSINMKRLLIILFAIVGIGMFVYFFMQSGAVR